MADHERRRLARQASFGDPQAAARVLTERLRAGELTRERLELAAYLGDPTARLVATDVTPEEDPNPEVWIPGLGRWGKPLLVRAALLAARLVLPRFEAVLTHERAPAEAIEAAEAWLNHPCEAHRVGARLCADAADDAAREASVQPEADDDTAFAAYAARDAARAAAAHDLEHASHDAVQALDSAGAVELDDALEAGVRQALIAWSLGRSGQEASRQEG